MSECGVGWGGVGGARSEVNEVEKEALTAL